MAAGARIWVVRGRVQGVGFRNFVQREASALSLAGWARNLADGRVEVFAQGAAAALNGLEGRLRQGPRWADVRGVEGMESPTRSDTVGFKIR